MARTNLCFQKLFGEQLKQGKDLFLRESAPRKKVGALLLFPRALLKANVAGVPLQARPQKLFQIPIPLPCARSLNLFYPFLCQCDHPPKTKKHAPKILPKWNLALTSRLLKAPLHFAIFLFLFPYRRLCIFHTLFF